jgi:phytanoyl-CoA hydroxylase
MNDFERSDLSERFRDDGYVILRAFQSAAEMNELATNIERFVRDVVPTMPADHVYFEDKNRPETLKQIQALHAHDAYFSGLFAGSRFERLAEFLLGGRVIGKNLQYFNKPSSVGKATPPHQDGYYFKLDPCEAVTMWLALDPVDEENGCVRYVIGSHGRGMRNHARTDVLGFSQGIVDYGRAEDLANERAMPADPGDLLVHHALLIHRADANRTASRQRRSLGFVYYAQRSREDVAQTRAYQERLTSDLAAAGKI